MPMYEFQCRDCSVEFEELSAADPAAIAAVECPSCHSRHLRRKLTAAAFTMSGSESSRSAPASTCSLGGGCGLAN
jgi:putative FmdB family regulatory protein